MFERTLAKREAPLPFLVIRLLTTTAGRERYLDGDEKTRILRAARVFFIFYLKLYKSVQRTKIN